MEIEQPECELGYTEEQVTRIMGTKLDRFNTWMKGATMGICDGRRYSHGRGEYELTGCGPHGGVTYTVDVLDFLAGRPVTD